MWSLIVSLIMFLQGSNSSNEVVGHMAGMETRDPDTEQPTVPHELLHIYDLIILNK